MKERLGASLDLACVAGPQDLPRLDDIMRACCTRDLSEMRLLEFARLVIIIIIIFNIYIAQINMLQYMIKCASQNIITLKLFYAEWLLTKNINKII